MRITKAVFSFLLVVGSSTMRAEIPTKTVFGQCVLPLGMEEGRIPDDAITASSSYETKSVGPQNARIRQEKNGGAWCPKAQISSAIREYLEVDLTRDHLIAWTETQGRFGNGQGQEYAEAFFLEYWRDGKWHQYKNLGGDGVLRGNSNTYLVEKQKLELPFVASRVRFVPYSQHPRTVCMRVEIYGCVWDQGIASYSAPRGAALGPGGEDLRDRSYDGAETEDALVDGLGQLTDGILGEPAQLARDGKAEAGSAWVGWADRETVELTFEFRELREFGNCTLQAAHLPERGIEVFSELCVWFSHDGAEYHPEPERLEVRRDEGAAALGKDVSIPLRSRIGKFARLELRVRSKWLLIGEVTFETVPASRNLTIGLEPFGRGLEELRGRQRQGEQRRRQGQERQERRRNGNETRPTEEQESSAGGGRSNETSYEPEGSGGAGAGAGAGVGAGGSAPDAFPVGTSQTYVGLVSGALTVLALLLTCTTFLMKQRGRNKVALLQKHTALLCGSPSAGITINMKEIKLPAPIGIASAGLSHSRLSLKSNKSRPTSAEVERERCSSLRAERARREAYEESYEALLADREAAREADSSSHRGECAGAKGAAGRRSAPERPLPTTFPSKNPRCSHSRKLQQRKVQEGHYAATDILTIKKRERSSSGSLFTSLGIREMSPSAEACDVQRISRHRLRILDKLGEGSFGLVYLCEAKGIRNPDSGAVQNRQIVIVRSLWRGVVDSLRQDFTRDMRLLASVRDLNIARIIALVEDEPLGAVFEYGQLGDLPTFLLERRQTSGADVSPSFECRLNFIAQIASAMRYLESSNIAHRDLAARNCVVGENLTIKVSDYAMYCGKYDRQYYIDGCYAKIPLRWMAWEAALLGRQNCRTDVWSYGVTVWEILTSCEQMPYAELTAEQVLENHGRWYHGDGDASERNPPRVLSQPTSCPDDLYRLMLQCWTRRPEDRPTFEEIYLYLERLG
ncbi:hypothetical protein KM043_010446 [Ampulex compressa]|nr:hypothetical protein KM043_010446 [Ampulex compressa]